MIPATPPASGRRNLRNAGLSGKKFTPKPAHSETIDTFGGGDLRAALEKAGEAVGLDNAEEVH